MRPVSSGSLGAAIASVDELLSEGYVAPAFLMAWSTLEAAGRSLLPNELRRPQTPARLVEVLAGKGHITPDEADRLRRLAKSRNDLVHGDLQTSVTRRDLKFLLLVLRTLLKTQSSTAAA